MIDARNCALRRQEEEKIFLSRNKEGEGEGHCVSELGFTRTTVRHFLETKTLSVKSKVSLDFYPILVVYICSLLTPS